MPDLSRYRPNVGVVLFHPDGRVWYGRRAGTPGPYNWQFPQGGVDEGEDYLTAGRRELAEETGVTSAELIGEISGRGTLALLEDGEPHHDPQGQIGEPGQLHISRLLIRTLKYLFKKT